MKTILDIYNDFDREFTNANTTLANSNFLFQNGVAHDGVIFSQDIYDAI